MELKLNVYKTQKEVEKTYVIDSYDLMTGTVEDFLEAINLSGLKGKTDNELYLEVLEIVTKNFKKLYPLVHDIFGVTEEEYRKTKVKELVNALLGVLGFSIGQIGLLKTKN